MEPMVTISVKDYNALIDKALDNSAYMKKFITKIKSLYIEEKNKRGKYHNFLSVENACDFLLAEIDNKTNIPKAVKEWEEKIDSTNEQQEH